MINIVKYAFERGKWDRLSLREVSVETRKSQMCVGFGGMVVGHTADGYPVHGTVWLNPLEKIRDYDRRG